VPHSLGGLARFLSKGSVEGEAQIDLKDILAALEGRPAGGARGARSEGGEAFPRTSHRRPFLGEETFLTIPHLRTFLRLFSDSWVRPPGLLSSSASGFDILLMYAERDLGKSVEDFGAVEWRAVAMFLGSVIDNPRKRGRGRPRKPFEEDLVFRKARGRPVMYDESYCRLIVQAIDAVRRKCQGFGPTRPLSRSYSSAWGGGVRPQMRRTWVAGFPSGDANSPENRK
jgi:hypothetical protein